MIVFRTQPAGARGGMPFATPPSVEIRDAEGKRVSKATTVVTIALDANPASGTLSGTLVVAAVEGVAEFADLLLDRVASGYTLIARAEGLTSATSDAFDVVAGPASRITFTTQPAGALGGTAFATQPVLEVLDGAGNRAVGSVVNLTVGLGANPGGGQLTGNRTLSTASGVAAFSDLAIDRAGTGYTLTGSATGLAPVVSGPFDVVVGPASAESSVVKVDRSRLVPGDTLILSLRARDAGGNTLATGGLLAAFSASGGTTQATIGATTDHGNGTYTARFVADVAGTPVTIGARINGSEVTAHGPTVSTMQFRSAIASALPGFSCGLVVDGTVYCWGEGLLGTLGDGTFHNSIEPREVVGGFQWASIAAGATHVCALTTAGAAYCWGSGDVGALGNGSSGHGSGDNRHSPVPVTTGLSWSQVTATFNASCAIDPVGAAYCWGNNVWGRLGDGTDTPSSLPRQVAEGLSWGSIGVGIGNGCGITTGGTAYCWGYAGVLAPGGVDDCHGTPCALTPLAVPGGLTFRAASITVDGNHACAIATNGKAYCWGNNYRGELGDGANTTSTTPVAVAGGLVFSQLASSNAHTCGVTENGDAYCWGANEMGHLGNGTHVDANTPLAVAGGFKFTRLSTGHSHTCGVTVSGGILCWGQNNEGQLGDGAPISSRPRPVWVRFR